MLPLIILSIMVFRRDHVSVPFFSLFILVLFLISSNPTSQICTATPMIHSYTFPLSQTQNPLSYCALSSIQSCVSSIRTWLLINKLKINDNKTEFQIIGTLQQLAKVDIIYISVGNASIPTSDEVQNLGFWFDRSLSMSSHVTKIVSSCLYNIRRIRKYLTQKACETLVNALITSRLDYSNSLLYGHPPTLLVRPQHV